MTSSRVVLCVICFLGVFVLAGLAGTIWLIDRERPEAMVAVISGMTGTALGALSAVLVSTRSTPDST